ncbi:developmental checkpoint coupling sporulation initiation to replication initiation [Halobacillus alkaliphilus]|uniref:Developmental checkpoint coupling sporulation initiation to replication initiation n=1 Tax=Halobacillus alkaliphilus TaxID=396056 RepID=A0A1I2LS73_9BACI|nr:sporulation histidine kinase inhibitor Sda [Halobacillus alkaliphilus]SFF82125.1 developmental checkpoint coupling sporulation initiation to replication initiation [Halobacillus alkaliphilus]
MIIKKMPYQLLMCSLQKAMEMKLDHSFIHLLEDELQKRRQGKTYPSHKTE